MAYKPNLTHKQLMIIGSTAAVSVFAAIVVTIIFSLRNGNAINQNLKKMFKGKYFTVEELCASSTVAAKGIKNEPNEEQKANIEALITNILDPLRTKYGSTIIVNSGFRCAELNKAVGGVATSQHTTGQAADITCRNKADNKQLFTLLTEMGGYDQLIWENGGAWVHISYKPNGGNRGQKLSYSGGKYTNIDSTWQTVIA